MADQEQVAILREDVWHWNQWREVNEDICPELSEAKLQEADLAGANLRESNLSGAELCCAILDKADLHQADLSGADLTEASLFGADLSWADLRGAKLNGADLSEADLSGADLRNADLSAVELVQTSLVHAQLDGAQLDGCRVYGASVWDVSLEESSQRNLVITPADQPTITVDDVKVAQFVYLLLTNSEVRHVIDTITSKVVLILGRFTKDRKAVLDALRNELRNRDYTPVLFDFEKPDSRDLTETISTLAHMARFVIADITDAKSIPQELMKIVPNLPSLPVRPIIQDGQYEYAMFKDFGGFLSVLPPWRYQDSDHLLASLETKVIGPALGKVQEIEERRQAFEQELLNR